MQSISFLYLTHRQVRNSLLMNEKYGGTHMIETHNPQQNQLLAALPKEVLRRLLPDLELISLALGDVLYEPGGLLQHVFFPITAIGAIIYISEDGSTDELAMVGHEGLIGVFILTGTDRTNNHAVVQNTGYAYRLSVQILKQELNRIEGCCIGALQNLFLHYMQALITHMGQTLVCSRHHALEQQLCRHLLLILDRLDGSEFMMTQESIANMLGVRRESITEAASKLQRAGLINYRRGHIIVLDRTGLEARTCECYQVVKEEYERLLPHVTSNVIGYEPAYGHRVHHAASG